jgi:hypothetical protein
VLLIISVAQLACIRISFLLFDSDLSASKLPSNFNEGGDEGSDEGSNEGCRRWVVRRWVARELWLGDL